MRRLLYGTLAYLLAGALAAPPLSADERAAALQVDRRVYAGLSGMTAQSDIHVGGGAGGDVNTLSDGFLLRLGRTGRPARYDVELARTRYEEGTLLLGMVSLDYLIPWGDLFSGFVGLVGGYARVEWKGDDPFSGGADFNTDGETVSGGVIGLRGGGLIEVTDLVQVEIGYRYLHTGMDQRFTGGARSGRVDIRNVRMVHAGVNFRF
ncbi:hypothetical protein QWY84_05180 [Aquisalimonas lutea]|uniref:hypothetical protein n=1 Tax=Aquisalimonas lutea TaxID=1327750 RepID=UPI0025B35CE3|nr:hypothetical protein [Aquisalimonas lutea]MDN3517002.1 hypothetical protein [Aquisalimonas lutea]